jgi:phosphoribosyl 1,2-cyclic phosphate phosphodiesterase
LGNDWGLCDSKNSKNKRLRCALLIEQHSPQGVTRVLIDTSPDMRAQLLGANVGTLDGVVYTHSHADHLHGLDDLRQIVFNRGSMLDVWANTPTKAALTSRFAYAFETPSGSNYPPILKLNTIAGQFDITGAGGTIDFIPFEVNHGTITALGFRIGALAYLPDVKDMPTKAWSHLQDLDVWILDALRRNPHPSHIHLDLSLDWIAQASPKRAVLTNMHLDMDYATLCSELPSHITPAYDGLKIEIIL